MTVARHYIMTAKPGGSAQLETALSNLADAVRKAPGSVGVELLRDAGDEHRFVFIEKWDSIASHKGAGDHIAKEALAPLRDAIDGHPEGCYLDYLKTV